MAQLAAGVVLIVGAAVAFAVIRSPGTDSSPAAATPGDSSTSPGDPVGGTDPAPTPESSPSEVPDGPSEGDEPEPVAAPPPVTGGCMPRPSACGWPDETNTGVPAGVSLTVHEGNLTITRPGTVIDGMDIRGCVDIQADDVTIRNSRIGSNGCDYYTIKSFERSNVLIEDTEIVLHGWNTKGIAFEGYTLRRVHFFGGADCAHATANVVIEDSFCELAPGGPEEGPHYDGFQDTDGGNIVLRHNTIRVPYPQTAAILMPDSDNVTIVDNLVAGGGYSIYCPRNGSVVFSGNRIARTYFEDGGYYGPVDRCPRRGAVWDDTGEPL